MLNNKLFAGFCIDRNLKISTINGYASALKLYSLFCKMSINDLINEAHHDEDKGVSIKYRRIKRHLIEYRSYLLSNLSPGATKTYFSKIKTFYSHFDVELPYLPAAKYSVDYESYYNDLPTKDHINLALSISSNEMRAIITFMATSGTAKAETLSLTVNDFINATKEYHDNNGLDNILNSLEKRSDVIPTWYLKRIKTNKYYYTFNHPEASKEIVKYLKKRQNLDLNDKLFPLSPSLLLTRFQQINDKFEWGFKGNYRFFRSHTLRKFHASNIGLSAEDIDSLQGRSKNMTHNTYIKPNPNKLKKIYVRSMENISLINNEISRNTSQNEIKSYHQTEFNISINIFLLSND
jgi:hypothetical protein